MPSLLDGVKCILGSLAILSLHKSALELRVIQSQWLSSMLAIHVSELLCPCVRAGNYRGIKLTRSTTSVASGVLLVFGGMSLSWGREC